MKFISVLITSYNRREITLRCLNSLYLQNGLKIIFDFKVFLVDDGSIDDTSLYVNSQFPDVTIIQGTGNLFWNRGMHLAWLTASSAKVFDFYLWLNDDTFLFPNALLSLLGDSDKLNILSGTTYSEITKTPTYGGYRNNLLVLPNGGIQEAQYCNGNCVLIPRVVFDKVGNLDPFFHHALGDFDYTLRASRLGIKVLVCSKFIGFCEPHTDKPIWCNNHYPFHSRIKNLYSPKSGCHPIEYFKFDHRHNGILSAVFHFFTIHLRVIFPKLIN